LKFFRSAGVPLKFAAHYRREKHQRNTMITDRIFAASIMTLALGFATAAADAAELFTLKSTTFADGKIMPKKVANSTANMPNNPNCVGANVSPQL
jgi:hypothetical protein